MVIDAIQHQATVEKIIKSKNSDPDNVFTSIYEEAYKKFDNITHIKKIDFVEATKAYAYHYDSYLNSVLRYKLRQPYNWRILLQHFVDISDDIEMWKYYETDINANIEGSYYNEISTLCKTIKHPFSKYHKINIELSDNYFELFSGYIQDIQSFLPKICNNLQIITITTDQPITLYRGLKITKGNPVYTDMSGFSSCSTSISSAIQIAINSGYQFNGYPGLFNEKFKQSEIILMKITFPSGTKFIPNGLCTIQNESELILCQNGKLEKQREYNLLTPYWNTYLNIQHDNMSINKPDMKYGTNSYNIPLTKSIPYRLIEYTFTKPTDIECIDSNDVKEVFSKTSFDGFSKENFMTELTNMLE